MGTINIDFATSCATSDVTTALIKALGGSEHVTSVKLSTKTSTKEELVPEEWPLIITIKPQLAEVFGTCEIRCKNLTSGYGGSGPNDTIKILEACGFGYLKAQIYSREFSGEVFTK